MQKRIVIANWKMNPTNLAEAKKLFLQVKKVASTLSHTETIIAPPFVFLGELSKMYRGKKIAFCGQDMSFEERGAFTGETSAAMLKSVGATHVIVGHSERRHVGETDEMVNKKIRTARDAGLRVTVAIGESDRNHKEGTHLEFLTRQIELAFKNISVKDLSRIMIAYEPLWSIGKSAKQAMKSQELEETVLFIRKILMRLYGKGAAFKMPILYGGSVEGENAQELVKHSGVQGFLVGHASISAEEFSDILCAVNTA